MFRISFKVAKIINNYKVIFKVPFLPLFIILIIFLFLDWFVSNPVRAAILDKNILYHIDEVFHYWYIKIFHYRPIIAISPAAKPLHLLISNIFFHLIPLGMLSLRIMNSFFSVGTLFILYKLTKKLWLDESFSILAILITVCFPSYFLLSISTLTEILFCFFLLAAIYFVYSEKYIFSIITVSLLPLIRQEGILYLSIWTLFLIKKSKFKYIPMLLMPSFIWILLNYTFLGHSFTYVFFPYAKISKSAYPPWALIHLSQINFFTFGGYYPVLALFFSGLIFRLSDRKYSLILICLLVHLFFLLMLQVVVTFLVTGCLWKETRYIIPIVPLIAIYATESARVIFKSFFRKELIKYFFVFVFAIMLGSLIYQTMQSNMSPKTTEDALTAKQEENLLIASSWVQEYLMKENIRNIYVNGIWATHKFMLRIMMNLPANINYLAIVENSQIFDPVTLKIIPNHKMEGVFVTLEEEKKDNLEANPSYRLIKKVSTLPMYFYLTGIPVLHKQDNER